MSSSQLCTLWTKWKNFNKKNISLANQIFIWPCARNFNWFPRWNFASFSLRLSLSPFIKMHASKQKRSWTRKTNAKTKKILGPVERMCVCGCALRRAGPAIIHFGKTWPLLCSMYQLRPADEAAAETRYIHSCVALYIRVLDLCDYIPDHVGCI